MNQTDTFVCFLTNDSGQVNRILWNLTTKFTHVVFNVTLAQLLSTRS